MAQKYFYEYEKEWMVSLASNASSFVLRTDVFYPLPHDTTAFYLEAFYDEFDHLDDRDHDCSIFYVELVNVSSRNSSKSLNLSVGMEIYNLDGSPFYNCSKSSDMCKIGTMSFSEMIKPLAAREWANSTRSRITLRRNGTFKNFSMVGAMILKCKMCFSDRIPIYSNVCEHGRLSSRFNKNISLLYEKNIASDIVFKVGDSSFPAHKAILAAHSTVFLKMVKKEKLGSCITLSDVSSEVFDVFLKYFYCGTIPDDLPWQAVKKLIYLAHKFDVELLKQECNARAILLLSTDLVCDILKVAYEIANLNLKTAAKTFAIHHLSDLLQSENWNKLVSAQPFITYEVMLFAYQNNLLSEGSVVNLPSNVKLDSNSNK